MSLTLSDPTFLDALRPRNAEAWNIISMILSAEGDVSAQDDTPRDMAVSPDGLNAFLVGTENNGIYQYSMPSPYDIENLTHVRSNDLATFPTGIFFKPDGLKMYIANSGNTVNQYSLNTAWNITDYTLGTPFSTATEGAGLRDVFLTADGLSMYTTFIGSDRISQYSLATRWDTSTAVHVRDLDVSAVDGTPVGLFFRPDGRRMYFVGSENDRVNEYNLSTPWNIDATSATFSRHFDLSGSTNAPTSMFFRPDGLGMVVTESQNDSVLYYELGQRWNISGAEYVENSPLVARSQFFDLFFHPDGTSVIVGLGSRRTFIRYDLATAWDANSMSTEAHSTYRTPGQGSIPSFYMRDDGTRMFSIYPLGSSVNTIYSYDLAAAWDLTDVSPSGTKRMESGVIDNDLYGITVGSGGDKMFFCGTNTGVIYETSLATAWDISSDLTVDRSLDLSDNVTLPTDLFFSPDGTQLFVTNQLSSVHQYDLPTAWNLTDAEYVGMTSVMTQIAAELRGVFLRSDGLKMYTADSRTNRIHEYDI